MKYIANAPNRLRQYVGGGLLVLGLGSVASGAIMSAERSDAAAGVTISGDIPGVETSGNCHNPLNPSENTVGVHNNRETPINGNLTVDPANAAPMSAGNFALQPGGGSGFNFLISKTEDGSVTVNIDGETTAETVHFNCDADAPTTTTTMVETTPTTFTIDDPQPTSGPANPGVNPGGNPALVSSPLPQAEDATSASKLPAASVAHANPTAAPGFTG